MKKNVREINEKEPISIIDEDFYRYPSCEFPRNKIIDSDSLDYEKFNSTYSKRMNKKVRFNKKVSIVNIQSHKKYYHYNSAIEEDLKEDKNKKCVNCNIF